MWSIRNKLQDLEALVYRPNLVPAIICLTETLLEKNYGSHTFAVPAYNEEQVHHKNRYSGGESIQVHYRDILIKTFEVPFEEAN